MIASQNQPSLQMRKDEQRPVKRDPQKIGDVVSDLLARRGYAQVEAQEECNRAWDRVVGKLGKFSRATEVKRGVLQVIVTNSVVMQELTFRKPELIATMSAELPNHQIKDLRFRVGVIS